MIPRVMLVPLVAWLVLDPGDAEGQTVRIGIHSVAMTHTEIDRSYSAEGVGVAGSVGLRWRRFGFEGMVFKAAMEPDSASIVPFDVMQWDVRFSYWLASVVGVEISGFNRKIDPEFAGPDVGALRIGFVSEYPLARIASVRARGAYLVDPKFIGGGESGLAVEIGLGIAVGTANGRFRFRAESDFQRIDREVNGMDAPVQVTQARLGVEVGF
jgi:hypothetical protein